MTLKLSLMRWLVTLVGVQFFCAIVWVLGPLAPALEPWPVRAVLIMALLMIWAAANLLLDFRRTQMDQALTQGLTGAAQDEAAAVQERLATALALLRQNKGKRGYLYEQPWYAIIGPPGAGKTTALLNAGLEFPLAGALGPGAVSGVGGTRLCEWWFTNDAVLIDTAGRYTTQDSNQSVDRAGWQAFLALLRRTRPKQPLNGVLVAIALDDVAAETPAAQAAHAAAIRSRIDELEETLGLRLPVYALLTKSDLLVGFTEFFDDLDRAGREQVWGATFPLEGRPDFGEALRTLLKRLDRRVFARLDAETNGDRRALIAGFPAQFASVLAPIQAFLTATFAPSAAGKAPMLRGVYFTSGTQEGTPIDRLTGALSRAFGLDQKRAARLRPEAGRAYFLAGLLKTVVFREAMLVSYRPGAARRRQMLRLAGFAVCALLAAAGGAFMLTERSSSLAMIDQAQAALTSRSDRAAQLPLDPVADADVASLLPWLDAARTAAAVTPQHDALRFEQDAKLAAGAAAAYRHGLDNALFPRLVWRAETQMRGALNQPDALYDATRIYLMLGGAGPLDRDLVREWFARDWAQTLPGDAEAGNRASLGRHLAALLDGSLPAIALDGPLVTQARTTIGRVPLAQRAWSRLKPMATARNLPPWRPGDALGPAGVRVFLRLSGHGLEEGIPGLYTIKGLREAVLPGLPRAAQEAAGESWVLGEAIDPNGPQRRTLEGDIIGLYAAEYAAAWDAMLKDLDLAPMRSLTQAAQDLYILASAHSPLRNLLAAAGQELAPAAALPADSPARERLAALDERYKPLRLLFGTGGAAPIDQAMRPLGDLQQQLAKQAASTTKAATPSAADDPAVALRIEAARQPQPLARWLTAMATGGAALRDGGPRGAMIVAWNAGGGPAALCPAIIADHFPFVAAATADASIEDFTRLFGPGGAIDAFFNAQLKPYVDMTAKPWKLQQVDGIGAPLTAADLAQFQRAATIRDLFFPSGSAQPLVRFDITAGPLDPQATSVRLDLGSGAVSAARDAPGRPAALTWPGRPPSTAARLTITAATPAQIEAAGPWALFRLLGKARATPSGDKTTLVFTAGDRQARFDLRATPNPFATPVLTEFKCPAVQ
jgi:type VI secretion system protein ImpL